MHKLSFNLNDPYRHMRTLDGNYGYEEVANYATITEELNYIHSKLNLLQQENNELRTKLTEQNKKQTARLNMLIDALAALTVKQLKLESKDVVSFELGEDGAITLVYKNDRGETITYHAPIIEEDL